MIVCRSTVRSRWSTATLSAYRITSPETSTAGVAEAGGGHAADSTERRGSGSSRPLTYAAWPRCWRQSPSTLTSRTPAVTGGSQRSSTTRSSSSASTRAEVVEGELVDGLVVVHEVLEVVDPHRVDLLGAVAVADVARRRGAGRTARPSRVQACAVPASPATWSSCTRAVCHSSQTIGLPGARGADGGRVSGSRSRDRDVQLADASEVVGEQLCGLHGTEPTTVRHRAPRAPDAELGWPYLKGLSQ